jgi:hypothetical protein
VVADTVALSPVCANKPYAAGNGDNVLFLILELNHLKNINQ